MLASQLAQTLKAQADNAKDTPSLPYALEKALRVAPDAFAGQTPRAVLATFEEKFPGAVDAVFTEQVLALTEAGLIPHLTLDDMHTVLVRVFGTEALEDHVSLFAPLILDRIRQTFGVRFRDERAGEVGDVWLIQRPMPKDTQDSLTRMCNDLEARFAEGISAPIDTSAWKRTIAMIREADGPAEKAFLVDDLLRDISAFGCPLRARDVVAARMTFDDMIDVALLREHVRVGIRSWIDGVPSDAPLHKFQRHTLAIPPHLHAIAALLGRLSPSTKDEFFATLNTELDEMLGVHASIEIDAGNTDVSVRLYLPKQIFKQTCRSKKATGTLVAKLRAIEDVQERTRRGLALADLEALLTDTERAAVDAAIEALKVSVVSDQPTGGVTFGAPYVGLRRHITTQDGILVPLALGSVFHEVILLKTGLQCSRDLLDNLISEVRPATDPSRAMTQAGKDLIAQQAAVLNGV